MRITRLNSCFLIASASACFAIALAGCYDQPDRRPAIKPPPATTFKPQELADALHSVIAADREVYAQLVMQRLHDAGVVEAKENWQETKALPLPTHLTRLASERIQQKGAEFHYLVRSLWPLNPRNGPQTDVEKTGLTYVAEHPDKPFYQEESLGGRTYFTAVYADIARVPLCAECHNAHPKSRRTDYKEGSVMGGIVVRVPLEF